MGVLDTIRDPLGMIHTDGEHVLPALREEER
jgi:hypothetical protein